MCPLHLHRGMTTRKLAWGLLGASLLAAFGCSVTKEEEESEPASKGSITAGGTTADVVLKSTLFLDGGCVATKVGPRHLLVAARCVVGKPAFAANKKLSFVAAAAGDNTLLAAFALLLDRAETMTRAALARLPAGTYRAVDFLDNDGIDQTRSLAVTGRLNSFVSFSPDSGRCRWSAVSAGRPCRRFACDRLRTLAPL